MKVTLKYFLLVFFPPRSRPSWKGVAPAHGLGARSSSLPFAWTKPRTEVAGKITKWTFLLQVLRFCSSHIVLPCSRGESGQRAAVATSKRPRSLPRWRTCLLCDAPYMFTCKHRRRKRRRSAALSSATNGMCLYTIFDFKGKSEGRQGSGGGAYFNSERQSN